jgi:acetoin utilization deacetylase AcuC-like enzyme
MQSEAVAKRLVILDCDVHQGNGTASILSNDETIFTFSIHGSKNYPFQKEASDLDISLKDGAGDDEYIEALKVGLEQSLAAANADLAIYIAGADAFVDDRLGRLSLTKNGLAQRDELVLTSCREEGIPVAVVMGGGYSPNVEDIVDIHMQTILIAISMLDEVKSSQ